MSNDPNRVYGGFSVLTSGVDYGDDASLIAQDQCAIAGNMTFRGSMATVRPPFDNLVLSFPDAATQANWNQNFQGACFYGVEQFGESGFVASIGGKLFRVTLGTTNTVEEITPQVAMVTLGDFTVPNLNQTVFVNVNIVGVKVGQLIFIGPAQFQVLSFISKQLNLEYVGGATSVVPEGATVYNSQNNQTGIKTVGTFTPPAINGFVNAAVTNAAPFALPFLYIFGGQYQMALNAIVGETVTLTCITNTLPTTVATGVAIQDSTIGFATQTSAPFTIPALSGTVAVSVLQGGAMAVNDILSIQGGTYKITVAPSGGVMTVQYTAAPTAVPATTPVFDYNNNPLGITVTQPFNLPSPGQTVTITLSNVAAIGLFQIIIANGTYLVSNITGTVLQLQFYGVMIISGQEVYDANKQQIYTSGSNPANLDFVDIFQAENYAIVLAGQNQPIYYDGSTCYLTSTNQLPPAVMGTYAWGRVWLVLNDRQSFIAGDLVGDPSGTPQNLYIDALLYVTENKLLAGGGAFRVPSKYGLITTIAEFAVLDTSVGSGPVMVGAQNAVISVNAPVDRTTWQSLTYPIQTVAALDYGPISPRGVASVNSDLWYRSIDGIRSFRVAQQTVQKWLNVPQSKEVKPILDGDSPDLLFNGSAILFDNKVFQTVSPYHGSNGIAHRGVVIINFDEITNLREKTEPAWEGIASGLQILQLVSGTISGNERAFAFVSNPNGSQTQIDTSNAVYVPGFPSACVITVTPGATYYIVPGINEQGSQLVNGTQTISVSQGTNFTITAQNNAFVFNSTPVQGSNFTGAIYQITPPNQIELWEILKKGKYDTYSTVAVGQTSLAYTPIQSFLETRRDNFSSAEQLKSLYTAELYIDQISDNVSINILYRPDEHPVWTPWTTLNFCATQKQCTLVPPSNNFSCKIFQPNASQYAARLMLPTPAEVVNTLTNGYMANGYEFQFRFEGTGHFRIRKFKVHAKIVSDSMEGSCPPTPTCAALPICNLPLFNYSSQGQT